MFTDRNGNVEAQRNFDPFGKPREASCGLKFDSKLGDLNTAKTRRGFTDHEHLDDMELIHMNGRVYDYNLGRFMSVDPYIQSPGNSQSINPYSYIMNNPLAGTDPTGYATELKEEKIRQTTTGSHIKRQVGSKFTSTTTNSAGAVTNKSTTVVMGSKVAISSTNYSNGAATSQTSVLMDADKGSSFSATVDINSEGSKSKNKDGYQNSRSASATDSDGNSYSFRVNQISAVTPEGAWGLIQSAQGEGKGYEACSEAGAGKDLLEHPLVLMATSTLTGLERSAINSFNAVGMRLAASKNPYVMQLGEFMNGFSSGFAKLSESSRREFKEQLRVAICGTVISCTAKFSQIDMPKQLPKSPSSIKNMINYLHRKNQTSPMLKKQEIKD